MFLLWPSIQPWALHLAMASRRGRLKERPVISVAGVGVGADAADFDSPLGVRVEQRRLQSLGAPRRQVHRRRWHCTHCSLALCTASAALCSAMIPAPIEVDDAWFHGLQEIHPRPRLTVARGSCLMLRTRALTHTGEDGHTIFEMDLRFESNPLLVTPHISLTVLARSAHCTGFYVWSLDACLCEAR